MVLDLYRVAKVSILQLPKYLHSSICCILTMFLVLCSWVDNEEAPLGKILASIDCYAGLLSGLVRDPSGFSRAALSALNEWTTGSGIDVSESLGQLQRCILWEIAEEGYGERRKADSQNGRTQVDLATEAGTSGSSPQLSEAAGESAPMEVSSENVGVSGPTSEDSTTEATQKSKAQKKPKDQMKQLVIHLVSSIHSLSQGLAKALGGKHRGQEKIVLGIVHTLTKTLSEHINWAPENYEDTNFVVKAAYLSSVVGELRSLMFNERQSSAHTLLLQQFYHVDGVASFLRNLHWIVNIYSDLRAKEIQQEVEDKEKGKEKDSSEPMEVSKEEETATGKEGNTIEKAVKVRDTDTEIVEGALLTFGTFLRYLVCGPMISNSPITGHLLTQTLPGDKGPFDPHAFVNQLHSVVLLSVLPIWNNPNFLHFPVRFITSLLLANNYIIEGEMAAAPKSEPKPKKTFIPNPALVEQLTEMGFSEARAEEALRQVGSNVLEAAMDWMFNNPEPEPAPSMALQENLSEEEELAAALAMSLGEPVPSSSSGQKEEAKEPEAPNFSQQFDILKKGMLEKCITLMTKVENLSYTVAEVLASVCKRADERAHVVDTLIAQIKTAALERPPAKSLEQLTLVLTLLMLDDVAIRKSVAESSIVPIFLDLLNLIFEDSHVSQFAQIELKEGPHWLAPIVLALDTICQLPNNVMTEKDGGKKDKDTEKEETSEDVGMTEVPSLVGLEERKSMITSCVGLMQRPLLPDSMHAILQLASRLSRNYELAQLFIQLGGLSALLNLPAESNFESRFGIISSILRHLIEEPNMLQQVMETEIKTTMSKLMGRSNALVKPKNFLSATAPLACRDCVVFLRAVANVCRLKDPKPNVPASRITLVPVVDAPHDKGKPKTAVSKETPSTPTTKVKTRRPATPVVQVITELTNSLIVLSRMKNATTERKDHPEISAKDDKGKEKEKETEATVEDSDLYSMMNKPNLSSVEILQILTGFVTAFPPCSSILLRHQFGKTGKYKEKDKKGKETGANNIISYILGELLPYVRNADGTTSESREKQNITAANLLAALSQRPEGRRRIIEEITSAMKDLVQHKSKYQNYPDIIHALADFLYLLLTSSATRSPSTGFLGEVARLMLDSDTIKTLTHALNSVDLNHPTAPQLVNAILKPLEILTRITAVMPAKQHSKTQKQEENTLSSGNQASTEDVAAHGTEEATATESALGAAERTERDDLDADADAEGCLLLITLVFQS